MDADHVLEEKSLSAAKIEDGLDRLLQRQRSQGRNQRVKDSGAMHSVPREYHLLAVAAAFAFLSAVEEGKVTFLGAIEGVARNAPVGFFARQQCGAE